MEQDQFDRLARTLAARTSRRAGFGAVVAGLAGAAAAADAVAGKRGKEQGKSKGKGKGKGDPPAKPTGPCGDRSAKDNECMKDSQCCTGYCRAPKKGDKVGRCRCAPEFHPCKKRTVCCPGLTCAAGACQPQRVFVATGQPCTAGSLCRETTDTCTGYAGGGPPGTYCLAPLGAACEMSTDCVDGYCGGGVCAIRPSGWTYQSAFSDAQTGGAYVVAATEDGMTVYVGGADPAYVNAFVTAWTRPATSGAQSAAWTKATTIASTGAGPGQVNSPAGISVSEYAGVLAVSNDADGGNIPVWAGEGVSWTYQSEFFGAPSGAGGSLSLTWDGLSIYLCDYENSVVSVYTRPNLASTAWTPGPSFGGSGPEAVSSPIGSALAASELEFYVADSGNNRVSIWTRPSLSSQTWTYATSFGAFGSGPGQFSIPAGMAIAPNGLTLWVADTGNDRVQVWTRASLSTVTWSYLTSFGTNGSGNGQLSGPYAVAVSNGGGYVYVADTGNDRVSVWVAV